MSNANKPIYILSIDAKDANISNNYIDGSENGYSTKYKTGECNLKKYKNSLDYSLEQSQLRQTYEKVYRRSNFSFEGKGKEYTDEIINLTFKFSLKEFNCIGRNTYIRYGYNVKDCVFEDGACIKNGILVGIKTNVDVENPVLCDLLGKYFTFNNGRYQKNKIPTLKSVKQLRDEIYETGFICNGKKYVRFKRSSGSSRVGKCLFIDENLYDKMHKWEMCGIKITEGDICDLAAIQSYISLTLSSIIDTVEINPEEILVIDDYDSIFKDTVLATEIVNSQLVTTEKEVEISNSIFDGQSILDISVFGKYKDKGMLLLRNRMFKSCCFNCSIQKFFVDNNIVEISQLNGFTLAKDISQIKLITTPSSIKYMKFGKLETWLKELDSLFGVVKYDKPTGRLDNMVQIHYQLLNSLQLSREEVQKLAEPAFTYLENICHEPAVLKHHIKYPEEKEFSNAPLNDKNEIIFNMLALNDRFYQTKLYHDFKVDLLKAQIKDLRCGHIYVHGNYSTMLGNPIEMLQQSIGTFKGKSQIGVGNIYCKNFDFDKTLLGSRSPHCTIGNILLATNKQNDEIERYFNLTKEISCMNSINENLLERFNGCDWDGDTQLLTDDPILIEAARKNYNNFKVPTSLVHAKKTERRYTKAEMADLDVKSSVNKIGEIINLSQELNSQLWDRIHCGESVEDVQELYRDISQLSVLSGIEIDKAKKEFAIDSTREMRKIKEKNIKNSEKYNKKPYFFKILSGFKGYEIKDATNYMHFLTSMDYLQTIIEDFIKEKRLYRKKNDFIPFSDVVNFDEYDVKKTDRWQTRRIIDAVYRYKSEVVHIWSSDLGHIEKMNESRELKEQCIDYVNKIKMNRHTMLWLIKAIESPEHSSIRRFLFDIFFGTANSSFFELIKTSKEPVWTLIKNPEGNIKIYDESYSLLYKKCD